MRTLNRGNQKGYNSFETMSRKDLYILSEKGFQKDRKKGAISKGFTFVQAEYGSTYRRKFCFIFKISLPLFNG